MPNLEQLEQISDLSRSESEEDASYDESAQSDESDWSESPDIASLLALLSESEEDNPDDESSEPDADDLLDFAGGPDSSNALEDQSGLEGFEPDDEGSSFDGMYPLDGDVEPGNADGLAAGGNPLGAPQVAARNRKGQRRYVKAYNKFLKSVGFLKKGGGSLNLSGSTTVGLDVLSAALSAAAHGIPIPTNALVTLGPDFTLTGTGEVSAWDSGEISSDLTVGLTANIAASVLKGLGFSAGLSVGASISLAGIYESVEHFAAVYLRSFTYLIRRVYDKLRKLYKLVKKGVKLGVKAIDALRGGEAEHLEDEGLPEYVGEKTDLPEYGAIRALEKKRRTRVKTVAIGGGVDAKAAGLLGAGLDAKLSLQRHTRKRDISGNVMHKGHKWHESKNSYTLNGSTYFDVGPFKVGASLLSFNAGGVYLTATVSGAATAVGRLAAAAPEALSNITLSAGDTMEVLQGVFSATITKLGLPIAGAAMGVEAGTSVTLKWYQDGKTMNWKGMTITVPAIAPFHLLYVRETFNLGGNIGASGIPLPGGVTLGAGIGARHTRNIGEDLGHHTIEYVKTVYLGKKASSGYRPGDWREWANSHEADLERIMRSNNAYAELIDLARGLGQEGANILTGELQPARQHDDFAQWLAAVERLFDLKAASSRGVGDVSPGWTKSASGGDRRRQAVGKLGSLTGSGSKLSSVKGALDRNDDRKLKRLRVTESVHGELETLAYMIDRRLRFSGRFPLPEFRRRLVDADSLDAWKSTVKAIFDDPFASEAIRSLRRA